MKAFVNSRMHALHTHLTRDSLKSHMQLEHVTTCGVGHRWHKAIPILGSPFNFSFPFLSNVIVLSSSRLDHDNIYCTCLYSFHYFVGNYDTLSLWVNMLCNTSIHKYLTSQATPIPHATQGRHTYSIQSRHKIPFAKRKHQTITTFYTSRFMHFHTTPFVYVYTPPLKSVQCPSDNLPKCPPPQYINDTQIPMCHATSILPPATLCVISSPLLVV